MISRSAPALGPTALFVAGLAACSLLQPVPLGLPAVGVALGLALRRKWASGFAAFCCGLVIGAAKPAPSLPGLDPDRTVEVVGRVSTPWVVSGGEARGELVTDTVVQGARAWSNPPRIALDLAGGVGGPAPGSRVRVRGSLRRAPGFANERASPPGRLRLRVKSARLLEVERGPSLFEAGVARLRERVQDPFAERARDHPGVAYAAALLFGDPEAMAERDRRAFRRAGLAHLVAVSGMNVALCVAFLAGFAAFLPRRIRLSLFLCAVAAHLLVVGPVPSLARASAMAVLALAALGLRRPPLALQALCLAVWGLLLAGPSLLHDLGFQLSCAATFGVVALTPRFVSAGSRGPAPWRLAVATSIAAQASTLPLTAARFAALSPAAVVLNLVFVPLASLLLVVAFGWAAIAMLSPFLAARLAWALDLLAFPFRLLPQLPAGAWLTLPADGSWITGCAISLWALAFTVRSRQRRFLTLVPLLLLCGGSPARAGDEVELVVADVGQGDGLLLRGGGRNLLVDGGGIRGRDLAAQVWLPLLARRGVVSLDAMAVSHADADHCGGLVDVAVHVPVRELWGPASIRQTGCVRELLAWSGATWRGLVAGDRIAAGPLRFAVLAPPSSAAPAKTNDASLVMRLEVGGRRVLLTGDLDGDAEARLVAGAASELTCDILKVGHHGSARGTSAALLAAAKPRLAVVSAGKGNRFGHPAPPLLARLDRAGVRLLRTDLQGEIVLRWRTAGALRIELPGSPRGAF